VRRDLPLSRAAQQPKRGQTRTGNASGLPANKTEYAWATPCVCARHCTHVKHSANKPSFSHLVRFPHTDIYLHRDSGPDFPFWAHLLETGEWHGQSSCTSWPRPRHGQQLTLGNEIRQTVQGDSPRKLGAWTIFSSKILVGNSAVGLCLGAAGAADSSETLATFRRPPPTTSAPFPGLIRFSKSIVFHPLQL
jgi:hypothetical protein